jgi:flagellar hook-associated protein 3 FlgL
MRFTAMVSNLFSNRATYNDLSEKIATQKKINRASDDPLAATKIITMRQGRVAIEQYMKNSDSCNSWLSATESTLSGVYKLLDTATGIANGGMEGDASTRQIAAENIQAIIDSIRGLANTKWGDRYLFSGSREGVEPFSADPSLATIASAQAAANNQFTGTAISGGAFTGNTNMAYALKITESGVLGTAKYQISADGGRTWGIETLTDVDGVVPLGDGVTLTFDDLGGAGPLIHNDIFSVNADAAGYYRGNSEPLSVTIDRETVFQYSISGAEAFTDAGGIDILKTLTALKEALISNDSAEISDQSENIKRATTQILLCQSRCGMKANHLDVVKNNLLHFDKTLNFLLTNTQDADLTELAAKLLMNETALKASYAMAGKIGEITILDYLR